MKLSSEQQQALDAQKAQCPFCKIIKGEIPSKNIYEDEKIIAILDINPATKGHILIVPKEHYPILPLLPQETFLHMAVKLKEISKSIMEGVLVFGNNIFVANGMVAGQQSQHFLIHVIPREKNDNIEVFELPKNVIDKIKEEELYKVLKQNLPIMLRQSTAKFPMPQQKQKINAVPNITYTEEELLAIIDKNIPLKRLIIENPSQFKQMSQQNQQLQLLFKGVNVDEIISIIRKKEFGEQKPQKQLITEAEVIEEGKLEVKKELEANEEKLEINAGELEKESEVEHYDYSDFLQVVNNNPKLKYLLLSDLPLLKEKIATVSQLAELFKDINVDKLRELALKQEEESQKIAFEEQIDKKDYKKNKNQENKKGSKTENKNEEDDLISRL